LVVQGVKYTLDAETGQGVNAATHIEGEQERIYDAVYVMQRETVQDPVSLGELPRLGQRMDLCGQRAVRVHDALGPASNEVPHAVVNMNVTRRTTQTV